MNNSEDKIFYVYVLINSLDGKVFYVGKGKGRRMYQHYEAYKKLKKNGNLRKRNSKKFNKINKIYENNGHIKYKKLKERINEEEAFALEKIIIKVLRLNKIDLTNTTEGGEGIVGYIKTEEDKRKFSEAQKRRYKRYPKTFSEETRKKLSIAQTGKKYSEESKKKMSESRKRWIEKNPGRCKEIANSFDRSVCRKGKTFSEESKRKISDSLKLYFKNKRELENAKKRT